MKSAYSPPCHIWFIYEETGYYNGCLWHVPPLRIILLKLTNCGQRFHHQYRRTIDHQTSLTQQIINQLYLINPLPIIVGLFVHNKLATGVPIHPAGYVKSLGP